MKKVVLLCAALAGSVGFTCAQVVDNIADLFPTTKGAQMVNSSYDAAGNLIGTMTTTVLDYYDYADGSDIQLGFLMKDANGNEINRGVMDAYYEDDSFYMKMSNNMHMIPDVVKYLSMQNDLVADFLDYPNPMGDEYPMDMYSEPIFAMDAGNYTITNKSDKSDFVRVQNHNRKYVGTETIETPAGEFKAFKISYETDVTTDGRTTKYHGVEWYAPGAGVVRSEIYEGDQLQNYTVLTSMTK